MRWTQNLRSKFILGLIVGCFSHTGQAQVALELSYNPGLAFVPPTINLNPSLTNVGLSAIFERPGSNLDVIGGIHFLNRGSGARVGIYQNGNFVRFQRNSENFYHVHVPLGIRLKQEEFYIDACAAVDRFLYYRKREAGFVTSDIPPTWTQNTLFGLHLEAGLMKPLKNGNDLKLGLYFTNNFGGATIPSNFMNLGVSIAYKFKFSESDYEEEEFEEIDDFE